MDKGTLIAELETIRKFFLNSTDKLEEGDSAFVPFEGMYSAAAQIQHVALTIDWFREGAFGTGFDMDFAEHDRQARLATSIDSAKAEFSSAVDRFISTLSEKTEAEIANPLPADSIMHGPRGSVVHGISDHTAHHRGALSVYIRALGRVPRMPYM